MADVKWIKIVTDVFDDEKMLLIDALPENDGIIVIWFKMLCLAGRQNNGGVFMLNDRIPYTDEMLSTIFRRPVNTVRLALKTFEQFGMIEIINDTITIPNWHKHQSLDKLEVAREKTRKRVAKFREKQKALASGENECNVTETLCNTTDKNREEKEKKRKDLEVEEEDNSSVPELNNLDPADKLQIFKGCILLSDNQMGELLDLMGLEIFDEYIAKLQGYINHSGRYVKNHYETLLKWYKEDTETRKRYNP